MKDLVRWHRVIIFGFSHERNTEDIDKTGFSNEVGPKDGVSPTKKWKEVIKDS